MTIYEKWKKKHGLTGSGASLSGASASGASLYEEWKKKHGLSESKASSSEASSSLLDEYMMKKKAETVYGEINEALSAFETSAGNYAKNYQTRLSNRKAGDYVSDSGEWLSEITEQKAQFDASAEQIKSLLGKYGRYYGEDYVSSVIGYLDGTADTQAQIIAAASKDNDYWKQFSKEQYESAYDSLTYEKKYEGKSYADVQKAISALSDGREKTWLADNADSFMSSADAQAEIDRLQKENTEKYGKYSSHTADYMNEFHSGPISLKTSAKNEELDRIRELEGIRDSAKNREELSAYEKYLPEAYEYANRVSQGEKEQLSPASDSIFGVFGQSPNAPVKKNTEGGASVSETGDIAFTEEGQRALNNTVDGLLSGVSNSGFMTDEENKMLRYLVYAKGAKEAGRYLTALERELNRRSAEQMNQSVSDMVANGNPAEKIFYSVASVGMNIVGGPLAFLDNLEQYAKGERIDPNRPAQALRQIGSGIRAETAAGIEKATEGTVFGTKLFGQNAMSMLYNALMSSADSVVGAYTLGNLYTVSMGMGAAASEAEALYNKGASNSQIFSRSLAAGLAEYITEKVSVENLIKPKNATGALSAAKEVLKQAGIEATEEMASDLLNLIADSAIMAGNSDMEQAIKKYRSGYTDEEGVYRKGVSEAEAKELAWRDFFTDMLADGLSGAISGGLSGSASTLAQMSQNKQNRKNVFSANERAVLDGLYEKRLSEAERDGSLSKSDKRKLREELSDGLKRGYISTDEIESVLGGESYTAYKNSSEEENSLKAKKKKLSEEIETLLDKPNPTIRDSERLGEARKELSKLSGRLQEAEAKTAESKRRLSDEVKQLTGNDAYLKASYDERAKRGEKFEADLSQYDEKQRAVVKKAIDSGFLNNTRRTHEFVDVIAKISADKGISFDFTDNAKLKSSGFSVEGRTVNGYAAKNGITVNMDSPKAWQSTVGHEITHILEDTGHYAELRKALFEYAESKGEYQSRLDAVTKLYENVKGADIDSELTAELVGEYLFTDENFINNLSAKHRNVFQRIYDEIKYLCKAVTAGSREARRLEKIKKAFDKAYRENGKLTDVRENGKDAVRYSLSYTTDNRPVAVIEENILDGVPRSQWVNTVKKTISDRFSNGIPVGGRLIKVNRLTRNEYTNSKYSKYIRDNEGEIYTDKFKSSNNIDDIVLASTNYINEDLKHQRKDNFKEFARGDVLIRVGNKDYSAKVIVGFTANKEMVLYDVIDFVPTNLSIRKSSPYGQSLKTPIRSGELSSDNSISQNESVVNSKDMQKSEKNSLSWHEDYLPMEEGDIAPVGKNAVPARELKLRSDTEDIAPVRSDLRQSGGIDDDFPIADKDKKKEGENGTAEEGGLYRSVSERVQEKIKRLEAELEGNRRLKAQSEADFDREIEELQAEYDGRKNKNTKEANRLLRRIERVRRLKDGALSDYEHSISLLEAKIENANRPEYRRAEQRKAKAEERRNFISGLLGDTTYWRDKKLGLSYKLNTLKRNLRDIVRGADGKADIERADKIYDFLQGAYNHHEAEFKRESEKIKKPFFDMKINRYESEYIQMLGEFTYNPKTTLSRETVEAYYEKHKDKLDVKKVNKAIQAAREVYEQLYHRINAVLREEGMKELGYIEGYFPHFNNTGQGLLGKLLNWKTTDNEIPTDIAGLTEQFKPKKSWQSFDKHRTGDSTEYNFLKGFDTYVHGALDWIYHIEDIQNRRELENYIRYTHSEKGVREKVDAVRNDPELDADEVQERIDAIYGEAENPLGNFLIDLRSGTNTLAGKKSTMDREMEYATRRKIYSTVTNINNRISANMIAGSISSALTNLIPITQSWSQVSPVSTIVGLAEFVRNQVKSDGIAEKSDFLTNRYHEEQLLNRTGWDKVSSAFSLFQNTIDRITGETIWRSKYHENLKAGMSESEAIKNADAFAEGVMAGRSRGNMPTAFNAKNPVAKLFTSFQLEVANQYAYMFKDMPQDIGKENLGKLTSGYIKMFVGAYIFNAMFSALTGRDAAFDPIGILEELLRELLGDDDEEEPDITGAAGNLIENVLENTPFVGGILGGGRVPISSALPYELDYKALLEDIDGMSGDQNSQKYTKHFWSELLKPLTYVVSPMGGGQLRKTVQGLSMFTGDKEVSGSYTDSGNLRFPVEPTAGNLLQAALFGQYASKNAREYFDNGYTPLTPEQTEEYAALGLPISQYREIKKGISEARKTADKNGYSKYTDDSGAVYFYDKSTGTLYDSDYKKSDRSVLELERVTSSEQIADYIGGLSLTGEQKNILYGNAVSQSLTDEYGYEKYTGYTYGGDGSRVRGNYLFDRSTDTWYDSDYNEVSPEDIEELREVSVPDISLYENYSGFEEFDFAQKNPEKYALSQAVCEDFTAYREITDAISAIKADGGSRKEKVLSYINGLDLDYGQKLMLFKSEYGSDTRFDYRILEYLGEREELSYEQTLSILTALGLDKYRVRFTE